MKYGKVATCAERIKTAMSIRKISQAELARSTGVSKGHINNHISGRYEPKFDVVCEYSKVLRVSPMWLLGCDAPMELQSEDSTISQNEVLPTINIDNKEIFAQNLNYYMELHKKSRREVSEALGVSYYTFTDWVKGKKYPRIDKIEALANYFGVSKADLIEGKKSPPLKSVGERIKQRRKELRMSADELGALLGKDRSTIYRYENEDIEKFPSDILKPIAEALQTTPETLMGWQETPDELTTLSEEERLLIKSFRKIPADKRLMALQIFQVVSDNQ